MKTFLPLAIFTITFIANAVVVVNAQNPCAGISNTTCGVSNQVIIPAGTGIYSFYPTGYNNPVWSVLGKEKIFLFTPTITGKYTLSVTNTDYNSAHYLFKEAALGCNQYSWSSIGSAYGAGSTYLIGTLEAGTAYYILVDAYSEYSGANQEFTINCSEIYSPCAVINPVNCNTDIIFTIPAGPGAIDLSSCASYNNYPDIGKEVIYSYTAVTGGRAAIAVTASTGWEMCTYYIKPESAGCNENNWSCLGGISSVWSPYYSAPFDVVAGTTYLIMVDVGSLNGASQTFRITCPEIYTPCPPAESILCATPTEAVIPAGFGAYDTVGQYCKQYYSYFYNTGKETIYSFTATVDGIHKIDISATDYNEANYTIKEASSGCNASGWNCIGSASYPGTALYTSIPLVAGTEYFIMVDATTPAGATHTFNILCEPPFDPCPSISSITCSTPVSYTIPEGRGAFMTSITSINVITEGKEAIYEFTPTLSGTHLLRINSNSGASVFYLIKEASSGCNENGWTLVSTPWSAIPSTKAIPVSLTAGTSYYIMLDTYYNNTPPGAAGQFEILCPFEIYDPCANIGIIPDCGTTMTTAHANGIGFMSPLPLPGYSDPSAAGRENIFSFTPSVTGKYKFMANDGTGIGKIIYSIKPANSGCNETGWLEIGTFYSNTGWTNYEVLIRTELQAGTTYYIMADPIDTTAISQTFYITCPVAYNPCNIIPLICGDYQYATWPAGNGAYTNSCNNIFPQGSELIFSFTPEETGQYFFDGSTSNMLYAYVKEATLGCNNAGWTCLGNEMYNTLYFQTPMSLQGGVEYYFMFQSLYDQQGYGYLSLRLGCQASCTIYADGDGDGYGSPLLPFQFCGGPYPGYSSNNNDCNDANNAINPGITEICANGIDDNCDGQIDEDCNCLMTVNAGIDESTFFGYTADQSVTHTAAVSGGTAPYTYSWTINRPLKCNQVNSAGDEIFMLGTCVNTVCPTTGQLTSNPTCSGSASIKVKVMDTTEVCVTVTDANGCIATDCFMVNATDARCFAGNSNIGKVKMCHHTGNPNNPWVQICVDDDAVANLIAQGDYVGNCNAARMLDENPGSTPLLFELFPNPASHKVTMNFDSETASTYVFTVTDITGRAVASYSSKALTGNNVLEINLDTFAPGIYYVIYRQNDQQAVKKLVVEK